MALRVAITGAAGRLGRELVRAFTHAGDEVLGLSRPRFELTEAASLARLTAWRPDVVVNSAAWTDVDGCARDPQRAMHVNGDGAGSVAAAARDADALIVQISTNEVFDGTLDRPYIEADAANPINPYGISKLRGEQLVASVSPRHLIVRTAWLFGPQGSNFVTKVLAAADRARAEGSPLRMVSDEWGNPTWVPALADAVVSAIERGILGTLHLAGQPPATRLDWASVALAGRRVRLDALPSSSYVRATRVPLRAVLSTDYAESLGIQRMEWSDATVGMVGGRGLAPIHDAHP